MLECVAQLLTETALAGRFFETSQRAAEKLSDLKRSEYKVCIAMQRSVQRSVRRSVRLRHTAVHHTVRHTVRHTLRQIVRHIVRLAP